MLRGKAGTEHLNYSFINRHKNIPKHKQVKDKRKAGESWTSVRDQGKETLLDFKWEILSVQWRRDECAGSHGSALRATSTLMKLLWRDSDQFFIYQPILISLIIYCLPHMNGSVSTTLPRKYRAKGSELFKIKVNTRQANNVLLLHSSTISKGWTTCCNWCNRPLSVSEHSLCEWPETPPTHTRTHSGPLSHTLTCHH